MLKTYLKLSVINKLFSDKWLETKKTMTEEEQASIKLQNEEIRKVITYILFNLF